MTIVTTHARINSISPKNNFFVKNLISEWYIRHKDFPIQRLLCHHLGAEPVLQAGARDQAGRLT